MAHANAQHHTQVGNSPLAELLFGDTRLAWLWLIIRLYAGYEWVMAGLEKLGNPVWTGPKAGTAIAGFAAGALKKTAGNNPDVTGWYASFLQTLVIPNAVAWSWLITFGEIAVGLGLIVGLFTGIAAFFGGLLNANYLLAGTVSTNPVLFILATWLVLAWRVAGHWGLDRWVLPALGVPGKPGPALHHGDSAGDRPSGYAAGAAR
ncbi:MAG TPA: DoxX family protein [Chloroflexota bacterium]|nr:DoxX family protein [Chloroflexota bacterium]